MAYQRRLYVSDATIRKNLRKDAKSAAARIVKSNTSLEDYFASIDLADFHPDWEKSIRRYFKKEISFAKAAASGSLLKDVTGKVIRETAKAILFKVQDTLAEVWMPKSQVNIFYKADSGLDRLRAPEWLLKTKSI